MKIKGILLVLTWISFTCTTSAQTVLNRIGDKVKDRTEQKTDETVDKVLDKVFGLGKKKKEEPETTPEEDAVPEESIGSESDYTGGINIGGMLSKHLGDGCEAKDAYSFDGNIVMHYSAQEGKKKGEEMEMSMRMHFSKNMEAMAIVYLQNSMGIEPESSMVVVDMKDSFTVMKMDVSGQAINMCTDMKKHMESGSSDIVADDAAAWTKTGRSKTILGYTCQEYAQEAEGNKTQVWVTEEIDNFMMNSASAESSPMGSIQLPNNVPMGYPLESVITSKDGSVAKVTTTEINLDKPTTIKMK